MKHTILSSFALLMAAQISSVLSQGCGTPGVVGGQCVKYFGGRDCNFPLLENFKPSVRETASDSTHSALSQLRAMVFLERIAPCMQTSTTRRKLAIQGM